MMKKKKKYSVLQYKPLPPHSNEPLPVTHLGEVSKPFIITIITILAVVLLAVFLLFQEKLVGKAYFELETGVRAGISQPILPIVENTPFSLMIKADLGSAETVGVEFQLDLGNLQCNPQNPVQSLLPWNSNNGEILFYADCDPSGNIIIFRHVTINGEMRQTGTFNVAQINLLGAPAGVNDLTFSYFNIYDLNNAPTPMLTRGSSAQVAIVAATESCTDGIDNDGDGLTDCADADCVNQNGPGNALCCNAARDCATGQTCRSNQCTAISCGDGNIDTGEECDDRNQNDNDGCSVTCQSCSPTNRNACSSNECVSLGAGVWDVVTNSCTTLPSCSPANRAACDATNCATLGQGVWDTTATPVCRAAQCTNNAPLNALLCNNDNTGFADDTARILVDSCNDNTYCEYTCDAGYRLQSNTCVLVVNSCTGEIPANADLCAQDDLGLTQDMSIALVGSCTTAMCEYTCSAGYQLQGTDCVLAVVCGNGIVEASEQCDDGDVTSGDGCSSICQTETISGGGPSGGSGRCTPAWQCDSWSFCNATLQESRRCIDPKRCQQKPKIEVQSCVACEESWVCSGWNACQNGIQTRTCIDEHKCGKSVLKPREQQSCPSGSQLPIQRTQQTSQYPIPPPASSVSPQLQKPSLLDQYKTWLFGAGSLLLLILLSLLAWYLKHKPLQMGYNVDELKEWIREEQEFGTSNEEITSILSEKTGWTAPEVENAFASLRMEK